MQAQGQFAALSAEAHVPQVILGLGVGGADVYHFGSRVFQVGIGVASHGAVAVGGDAVIGGQVENLSLFNAYLQASYFVVGEDKAHEILTRIVGLKLRVIFGYIGGVLPYESFVHSVTDAGVGHGIIVFMPAHELGQDNQIQGKGEGVADRGGVGVHGIAVENQDEAADGVDQALAGRGGSEKGKDGDSRSRVAYKI